MLYARLEYHRQGQLVSPGGAGVDAAVAVGYALAVTHPQAGNLGGGGFMMIRTKEGNVTAIDFREMAPAAATRDMFLDGSRPLMKYTNILTFNMRAICAKRFILRAIYDIISIISMWRNNL